MGGLAPLLRQARRGRAIGSRLWLVAAIIAGLAFTVAPVAPARAATLTVTNTNDAGAGSLRAAVLTANDSPGSDTIRFALGAGPHTITLTSGDLLVTSSIAFEGPEVDIVTISGNHTSRVFRIDGGTVSFNKLIITQGTAPVAAGENSGRGGGLFVSGGTVTLTNSEVSGNAASASFVGAGAGGLGGGIYVVGGMLTLINTSVSFNTARGNLGGGRGGGLYVDGGTVAIVDSSIGNNAADGGGDNAGGFGGGLYVANGTTTLTNSTVSNNKATGLGIGSGSGGGLFVGGGTINLVNSTVSNNLASDDPAANALLGTVGASGGGLYLSGGTATLTESTFSDNVADGGQFGGQGGAAANAGGTLSLNRSTIAGNTAGGGRSAGPTGGLGGGLYVAGGTTTVSASLLGSNEALGAGAGSGFGGGAYVAPGAEMTVANGTVYQNSAKAGPQSNGVGGGIYIAGAPEDGNPSNILRGKATLRNSTISENVSAGGNGGIGQGSNFYFEEYGEGIFSNTIVSGVSAVASCARAATTIANVTDSGANFDEGGSCGFTGQGSISGMAPLLQEVPAGTDSPTLYLQPMPGSKVIDAGNNATCTTTDQRGFVRPQNGKCDIGAVEVLALYFGDVAAGDAAAEAIKQLAARGIINGCDKEAVPPLFCPDDTTLRHQMAALIVRAMPGWQDETWPNTFTDPTDDAELWRRVGTLQHYGVVTGYTAATCVALGKVPPCYGPLDPVLKAQAISFITRAMVAKGYWVQQATNPALYGGVLLGTGHEQDATTYWHYTRALGGVPDHPESDPSFPLAEESLREWFARLLWTALQTIP